MRNIKSLAEHRKFVERTRAENLVGNIPHVVANLERFISRANGRGLPARGHAAAMDMARRSFVKYRYYAVSQCGEVLEPVQTITIEAARAVMESDQKNVGLVGGWIETIAGEAMEKWDRPFDFSVPF